MSYTTKEKEDASVANTSLSHMVVSERHTYAIYGMDDGMQ